MLRNCVFISYALCRAALMMLPSSAALCEKSKRRRRVGREPILRRLDTVHGHWCCWIDVAPDVNKNGEGSGSDTPSYLCLTSEHHTIGIIFKKKERKTRGTFFSSESVLTARPMVFIWHKADGRLLLINTWEKRVIMTLVSSSKRKPSDCFYAAAFCLHLLLWISCAVSGEGDHQFSVEVR